MVELGVVVHPQPGLPIIPVIPVGSVWFPALFPPFTHGPPAPSARARIHPPHPPALLPTCPPTAPAALQVSNGATVTMASKSQVGRWKGMDAGSDASDDQQDITRGRMMVDSLFQGAGGGDGTHNAILSSADYLSQVRSVQCVCVGGGCGVCVGCGVWGGMRLAGRTGCSPTKTITRPRLTPCPARPLPSRPAGRPQLWQH